MNPSLRKFHRIIGPWLAIPLFFTVLTGLTHRVGRAWFGMEKETGWRILDFHTGEWAGEIFSLFWVGITGALLLFMIATGLGMLRKGKTRSVPRRFHKLAAALAAIPLALTVFTGILYRFSEAFFEVPKEFGDALMVIHQGSWLGPALKPFYVIFLAAGFFVLAGTGVRMALRVRQRKEASGAA